MICYVVLFPVSFFFEAISVSVAGYDAFAVFADFLSESRDVHVHRAAQYNDIVRPYLGQYFLTRIDMGTIGKQQVQNLELGLREVDFLSVHRYALAVQVHDQ